MLTIHKFQIAWLKQQTVRLPKGARILSAQLQGDYLCLWALVIAGEPNEPREVYVYGTGHKITHNLGNVTFIATVQVPAEGTVFHVFADNHAW